MSKFVLTYHGGSGMPEDPAEVEKLMGAWGAWFESMGAAVVDGGNPFGEAKTIAAGGATTEGTDAELTGYSVITADDLDSAVTMAKGCPVLDGGGSVQVYSALEM